MPDATAAPQPVTDLTAALGEGPCWDAGTARLYWVDIEGARLHSLDPATGASRTHEIGQRIGAVVPRTAGGLVAALHHGFALLDPDSGRLEPLADPEADLPDNRFNDGKCDPAGRFWAGTMSMRGQKQAGALYRLDADRKVHRIFGAVTTSNGLAWSPDESHLYYIDTPTREVVRFSYRAADGAVSDRRTCVRVPEELGFPDGMTVDADGRLWVCMWQGWAVTIWDPATGRLLDRVPLPVARVTSCAFGGPDLETLFLTTARIGIRPEEPPQPLAGRLFSCRPGARGLPAHAYAG